MVIPQKKLLFTFLPFFLPLFLDQPTLVTKSRVSPINAVMEIFSYLSYQHNLCRFSNIQMELSY